MSTAGEVLTRARRDALAGWREQVNRLAGDVTDTQPEIAFTFALRNIQAGSVVELDDELVYVWSISQAGTATVERGWLGTSPAPHQGGVIAWINPRFTRAAMLDALNAELTDLCSPFNGIFRIRETEVMYNALWQGYDLTGVTDLLRLQDLWQRYSTREWVPIHQWDVTRQMPTEEFSSGYMLRIHDPIYLTGPIRVSYRAPYGQVTSSADNLQDDAIGVPVHMEDVIAQGVVIQLMATRELKRNFNETQGEPRRQDEVPPGATNASMSALVLMHDRGVRAEANRLHGLYPTMLRAQ